MRLTKPVNNNINILMIGTNHRQKERFALKYKGCAVRLALKFLSCVHIIQIMTIHKREHKTTIIHTKMLWYFFLILCIVVWALIAELIINLGVLSAGCIRPSAKDKVDGDIHAWSLRWFQYPSGSTLCCTNNVFNHCVAWFAGVDDDKR